MSVVFVLGAGASYGESLESLDSPYQVPAGLTALHSAGAPPPLIKGFFQKALYSALKYDPSDAEADYKPVFDYARDSMCITDPFGEGRWNEVDLEDLFTSVEIHREFSAPESVESGLLGVKRNLLARYIQRILGLCTSGKFGQYSKLLVSKLTMEHSVITFNYDLLLDQQFYELSPGGNGEFAHYENFESIVLQGETKGLPGPSGAEGLYLKLHGSLNWSQCTNRACPRKSVVIMDREVQRVLNHRMGIGEMRCEVCNGELAPLLIPPLLDKPIAEIPAIRAAWGLAQRRLSQASTVVLIGYSAPPTDFYSKWLLRSNVGTRKDVNVFVVDPDNEKAPFKTRMMNLFPYGYKSKFTKMDQVGGILESVGLNDRR